MCTMVHCSAQRAWPWSCAGPPAFWCARLAARGVGVALYGCSGAPVRDPLGGRMEEPSLYVLHGHTEARARSGHSGTRGRVGRRRMTESEQFRHMCSVTSAVVHWVCSIGKCTMYFAVVSGFVCSVHQSLHWPVVGQHGLVCSAHLGWASSWPWCTHPLRACTSAEGGKRWDENL